MLTTAQPAPATLAPVIANALLGASEALFAPPQVADLQRRFGALPLALASYCGFECRLAADEPQVDVQWAVAAAEAGPAILAGEVGACALPESWQADGRWQAVARFARDWLTLPAGQLPHVWLALDGAGEPAMPPAPLLHLRCDKLAADAIAALVAQAAGMALTPGGQAMLARCLAQATPTYVGFAPGPQVSRLRLTQPIAVEEAPDYLAAINWPGDGAQARELLALAGDWSPQVGLSLDIGEQALPYLGLETLNWTKPGSPPSVWARCLDRLVDAGWCSPAKRAALDSWPGIVHSRAPHWLATGLEDRAEDKAGDAALVTLVRNRSHIKLVLRAERPPQAKAYLDLRRRALDLPRR